MDRKNGATHFLRLPPTRRRSCAHRAACSRVMGGCSFFLWCSARPQFVSSNYLCCGASFPPDALPGNSRLILLCYHFFFFLSVLVGVLGSQTSSMHRAGHIEEKTTIKSRGSSPSFFLNACFLIVYFLISPF